MVKMAHGTYKGPKHGELEPGMTALLLTDRLGEPEGEVIAQLDRKVIVGTVDLSLGWHKFQITDWELDPEPTAEEWAMANSRRPGAGSRNLQDGGPMHAAHLNTSKPGNY